MAVAVCEWVGCLGDCVTACVFECVSDCVCVTVSMCMCVCVSFKSICVCVYCVCTVCVNVCVGVSVYVANAGLSGKRAAEVESTMRTCSHGLCAILFRKLWFLVTLRCSVSHSDTCPDRPFPVLPRVRARLSLVFATRKGNHHCSSGSYERWRPPGHVRRPRAGVRKDLDEDGEPACGHYTRSETRSPALPHRVPRSSAGSAAADPPL